MLASESHFIPKDFAGTSKDTAVLLVGTAREFNIDQHEIEMVLGGGFRISTRLRDVLYDEGVLDKTSGNRAVKKNSNEEQ